MSEMLTPYTRRLLTSLEVRKLRSVLQEPYTIHNMNQGSSQDYLEIQPFKFLLCILEKLNQSRVGVSDVRINGGAAAYILNPTASAELTSILSADSSLSSISSSRLMASRTSAENSFESQKRHFNDLDIVIGVKFDVNAQNEQFERIRQAVLTQLREEAAASYPNAGIAMTSSGFSNSFINKMFKKFERDTSHTQGDLWSLMSLHNRHGRGLELKFVHTMNRQYEFTTDSFQIIVTLSFLKEMSNESSCSQAGGGQYSKWLVDKTEQSKSTIRANNNIASLAEKGKSKSLSTLTSRSRSASSSELMKQSARALVENPVSQWPQGDLSSSITPFVPLTNRTNNPMQTSLPIPEYRQKPPPLTPSSPIFQPKCISLSSNVPLNPVSVNEQLAQVLMRRPRTLRQSHARKSRRKDISLDARRAISPEEDILIESVGIPPDVLDGLRGSSALPHSCFTPYLHDLSSGRETRFIVRRRPSSASSSEGSDERQGFQFDCDDESDPWDTPQVELPILAVHNVEVARRTRKDSIDSEPSNESNLSTGLSPHELGLEAKEESEMSDLIPSVSISIQTDREHSDGSASDCRREIDSDEPSEMERDEIPSSATLVTLPHSHCVVDSEEEMAGLEPDEAKVYNLFAVTLFNDFDRAYYDLCHRRITIDKAEEIRGGGLLRYCDLTHNGYELSDTYGQEEKEKLESTMLTRFIFDYDSEEGQTEAVQTYLKSHYTNRDWVTKQGFLQKILDTVPRISTNTEHLVDVFVESVRRICNDVEMSAKKPATPVMLANQPGPPAPHLLAGHSLPPSLNLYRSVSGPYPTTQSSSSFERQSHATPMFNPAQYVAGQMEPPTQLPVTPMHLQLLESVSNLGSAVSRSFSSSGPTHEFPRIPVFVPQPGVASNGWHTFEVQPDGSLAFAPSKEFGKLERSTSFDADPGKGAKKSHRPQTAPSAAANRRDGIHSDSFEQARTQCAGRAENGSMLDSERSRMFHSSPRKSSARGGRHPPIQLYPEDVASPPPPPAPRSSSNRGYTSPRERSPPSRRKRQMDFLGAASGCLQNRAPPTRSTAMNDSERSPQTPPKARKISSGDFFVGASRADFSGRPPRDELSFSNTNPQSPSNALPRIGNFQPILQGHHPPQILRELRQSFASPQHRRYLAQAFRQNIPRLRNQTSMHSRIAPNADFIRSRSGRGGSHSNWR